jgi:glutathione S-transferase
MSIPTLKLYYAAQTRAGRARWMLEEIGEPYELVRLDLWAGDQKKPEYLALNPNGTVPTLVDGDLVVFESAAIVQYLADKFPTKRLAPPVGTAARGKYYQWIHYAMSSLEPPAVTFFLHTTGTPVGKQHERIPQLVDEARAQLAAALNVTDDALAGREYIVGNDFSAADVMIGSMVAWCLMLGTIADDLKNLHAYVSRILTRPAFLRAQAD